MGFSRIFWRTVMVGCASLWAAVMIVIGIESISRWSAHAQSWRLTMEHSEWLFYALGVVLVALGQFVLAVAAGRLFPRANQWVTGAFEMLPWVVVLVVVVMVIGAVVVP